MSADQAIRTILLLFGQDSYADSIGRTEHMALDYESKYIQSLSFSQHIIFNKKKILSEIYTNNLQR